MTKMERELLRRAKKLNALAKHETPRAAAKALNGAIAKARTQVVKNIAKTEKLPAKHIRKKIFIGKATPKKQKSKLTTYTSPVSVVSLLRSAVLLRHARRGTNRRGVRAAGRQFDGAFINVHRKTGRFHVYERKGEERMPIDTVKIYFDKTAEQVNKDISGKVMRDDFERILRHELEFRTNKLLGG